ncbi:MAG TPA: DNA mismatch repair endonuclease MutL [Terracidiphilus sp.]|nr:DNA mismatch repair endonuclease MutL [Terracidiphilus sp.]
MGRIRILSDQVANQIAAGEVVDRPASVVKELLENAIDAGASRIRVEVEAGGRKLIRMTDDGHGMNRDDALLAFERHATSKLRSADDLLAIATLGFRGEALPSIASVARVTLETAAGEPPSKLESLSSEDQASVGSRLEVAWGSYADGESLSPADLVSVGTRIQIAGGKILTVEDAALPRGTTIAVSDLFFNTPARRKFLRAESTELAHVTALVTHYALVHPEKHFELLSASHTIVSAPPVARTAERIYQIFGKETLGQLLPVAAELPLDRAGLPEPPPWKVDPDAPKRVPGAVRLSGFYSKPELQKLNRNSIYIFVNKRLIRDRLMMHAIVESYRNVIPPTSFPVVLLFLEMPPEEVDVNVHPAKTEVRFRQQTLVHDFVRDSLRTALVKARPAAGFLNALNSQPTASPSLIPTAASPLPGAPVALADSDPEAFVTAATDSEPFRLTPRLPTPIPGNLPFGSAAGEGGGPEGGFGGGFDLHTFDREAWGEAAKALFQPAVQQNGLECSPGNPGGLEQSDGTAAAAAIVEAERSASNLNHLGSLKPLGQLRESFILATGADGLWIVDQHVAHERVLFEKILRDRQVERVQRQRLLMPLLVELKPEQMIVFARISEELERNGFEVEPFGPQTLAVKASPVGLEGAELERTLAEVIEQSAGDGFEEEAQPKQNEQLTSLRNRVAASIACHSAIKVNTPLDPERMEWLLLELAKTSHPTSCPHGRPIALLYSWREIQRAFHRV